MNVSEHVGYFIQEMKRRGMSPRTISSYSSNVKSFFAWTVKDHPKNINKDDIVEYLSLFNENNTQRSHHQAIKKFYEICLNQPNKFKYIPYCKKSEKKPIILSVDEIQRLIDACGNLKHKTIICLVYATGVRMSELLGIRLCDIDRGNMVIHVINGKGEKQRQVTMKPRLLSLLEEYYRAYEPETYLFEGDKPGCKYTSSSVNSMLRTYAKKAGIKKRVYCHLLRHNYATHSLEEKENLYTIQKVLGHASPKTTADTYLHTSPSIIANAHSPIQNINL